MVEENNVFRNNGQEFDVSSIPIGDPGLSLQYSLKNNAGITIEATLNLCFVNDPNSSNQRDFLARFSNPETGPRTLPTNIKITFECPDHIKMDDSTVQEIIFEETLGAHGQQGYTQRYEIDGRNLSGKNKFTCKVYCPEFSQKIKIGMKITLVPLNLLPSIKDLKLNLFEQMVGSFKNIEDFKIVCKGETIGINKCELGTGVF